MKYRYGFNGKENDNEVKGVAGSQQDYGFRIYDPRLGKFLSVDPLTSKYPFFSPYHFAGNSPIRAIDLDGLEPMIKQSNGVYTPPSDQIQKPLDPAAVTYLANKSSSYRYKEPGEVSQAGIQILAPVGIAINTFISGYDDDGTEATVDDYILSTANLITFGFMFGGEGEGKISGGKIRRGDMKFEGFTKPPYAPKLKNGVAIKTIPEFYLDKALKRQGLNTTPDGFKEAWSENGFDYEVRIHGQIPNMENQEVYIVWREDNTEQIQIIKVTAGSI